MFDDQLLIFSAVLLLVDRLDNDTQEKEEDEAIGSSSFPKVWIDVTFHLVVYMKMSIVTNKIDK
jgi:hypothetical protein